MLNLTTLRTPGVYIDEVPKFPPSIAAAETAVPAFIGYTELTTFNGKDYTLKPTRVEALVEYEELFGRGPRLRVNNIDLNLNNTVKATDVESTYYLYDSLQMYFKNGGGKCYIISLGRYPDPFSAGNLSTGIGEALAELEKEDEPTLILFPDGIKLSVNQLGGLHSVALAQCEKLKDRFLLADVIIANPSDDRYRKTDIDAFRTAIGMGNLQFGAAYYPYLRVNLPRQVRFRDVRDKVKKLGMTVNWATSFIDPADADTLAIFAELGNVINSSVAIENVMTTFLGANASVEEMYLAQKAAFFDAVAGLAGNFGNIGAVKDAYRDLWDFQYRVLHDFLDEFIRDTGTPRLAGSLLTELRTTVDNELAATPNYLTRLFNVDRVSQEADVVKNPTTVFHNIGGRTFNYAGISGAITAVMAGAPDTTGLTLGNAAPNTNAGREIAVNNMIEIVDKRSDDIFYSLFTTVNNTFRDAENKELSIETEVLRRIPVLANVITYLREESFLLPPTGPVAGLYCRVDANRGVWKSPANESLINVVAPSVKIELSQNDELNVDVNFGKSINVIKAFTGKGTLVWGARTLAGNNNEWRYVSVRRFFNMVEESSKKATEPFVFESNDANTWVKVQAMIENFLTTLWRQGALQGAVTEHAFYVSVGLGKTMTPLDILEGRMIVEIGLAVVRPAEFIILRFSHKMPES
jgi:uncharacterized protein